MIPSAKEACVKSIKNECFEYLSYPLRPGFGRFLLQTLAAYRIYQHRDFFKFFHLLARFEVQAKNVPVPGPIL